ncbi:GntR family transcriptional regulator [bacterium]|nr:GntR family transcriptional regulator [bacterium]
MKHLTSDDIKISKPDFDASRKVPKGQLVTDWLIGWIKHSLEFGIADIGDFIPTKEELAKFLDVSPATIQNSIRQIKDLGYVISKQSLGTCIADFYSKDIKSQDELYHGTITECKIKKIVIDDKIELNQAIPSISELAYRTHISQNTIRFCLMNLAQKNYLEKVRLKGNKYSWIYKKEFVLTKEEIHNGIEDENFTLTHQLVEKIKNYIEKTYKQGEKILPNSSFSNMFDVSIKTINDAMKILNAKKIILSRRGRYGTIYLGNSQHNKMDFVSSERRKTNTVQNYTYSWQKALGHLKKYIVENYETGDKIAPIRELATILNVSPNTIRRALSDLFQSGHLIAQRGKSGGIFIMEMPEIEGDSYRWLALNPDAISFKN